MLSYKPSFNLLIADDHQLIIDGLSRILMDDGVVSSLYSATNGRDAVDLVFRHDIDCVLMDINMPLVNGYEATKMIREKKPLVRIIVVSMISDAPVVAKLLKAGADGFIIKNTGKEELLKAISKVMDGEKFISRELHADLYHLLGERKTKQSKEDHLTPREHEIIRFISEGMTNQDIAAKLFLSPATVDTHRKNILAKLKLKNTASLVRYAAEHGLF
jgi:two-component system, NarL family, nitrate/nitrite response regulator NarL